MKAFLNILRFLIGNFQMIHSGVFSERIFAAFKIAAVSGIGFTISESITSWYIVNKDFMQYVFWAIAVDHILGSIVHARIKKDFTFKKNGIGLVAKISFCVTGYILFTMTHEILKDISFIADYFKVVIQLVVFLWPAGSAMGNMSILTGGKFPPLGWMKIINRFQENLDVNEFKTNKNENSADNS